MSNPKPPAPPVAPASAAVARPAAGPATTIDGVIARLQAIVQDCIVRRDRNGYFAALYLRVTQAVRDGIRRGEFDDGPRMERLDVLFANRYLSAYDQYRAGELPTRSWLRAFTAAADPNLVVLQDLLAGMNAHINLDLGIAAARVAPGAAITGLRADFDRINDVLARLTPVVEQQLDGINPLLDVLSRIAPKLELRMVGFSMEKARAAAWAFAVRLSPLAVPQQLPVIAQRDLEVGLIADAVVSDNLVIRALRAQESRDVARNIQALAAGTFAMRIAPVVRAPAPPPAG